MERFSQLFDTIDQTTKTSVKVNELALYFSQAPEKDVIWTIALLSHRRPKRSVRLIDLKQWASDYAGIPLWLFEESYHIVGDLAETIASILPANQELSHQPLIYWIDYVRDLAACNEEEKKARIIAAWTQLGGTARFVFNKIITGGFRVGVSQQLMIKALAKCYQLEEAVITHRLMGNWDPLTASVEQLLLAENPADNLSRPYPFYLAYAVDFGPEELGEVSDWIAEYKWDGIRGQLIAREGECWLWSRGEELITDKFPELASLGLTLPKGTVIDGEVLPFKNGRPLSFALLQTRIGRKNVTKKHLEEAPVVLLAYDLLEWEGQDLRALPLSERRSLLERIVTDLNHPQLLFSNELKVNSWGELKGLRENSREQNSEGLMLKRRDSIYQAGRKRGDWWKWKVNPLTIDAVMIYAMRGHGRRANLYSDYTFAVWDGDLLVPFAKAYSGLTDEEMNVVDRFVKQNTVEKFGPVRSVKAELVFELAFEGIAASPRHKSGIALRFPRINRFRPDKPASEANTIGDLQALLAASRLSENG